MILAIRTDSPITHLGLLDGYELKAQLQWGSGRKLADELMLKIETFLGANNTKWDAITGIVVFRGPGSFTGLRIGATVANTISYAQSIPIVGAAGDSWVDEGSRRLHAGENDQQVVPEYGAPANITRPKR